MRNGTLKGTLALTLALGALASAPALADKPEWKGNKHEQRADNRSERRQDYREDRREDRRELRRDERRDERREERRYNGDGRADRARFHHPDRDRVVIRDYYRSHYDGGRCPPGLKKKHNGCMPPGLAKSWTRGRPLPSSVIYYDLPPQIVLELGVPPRGHRYVRVAADILLIAVGTGMVVDAIEDLGW